MELNSNQIEKFVKSYETHKPFRDSVDKLQEVLDIIVSDFEFERALKFAKYKHELNKKAKAAGLFLNK